MFFSQIADSGLSQYAYLIGCQRSGDALLIDPARDIDRYQRIAASEGLRITSVAETHIHADFVSGARQFAEQRDVRIILSKAGPAEWQYRWVGAGAASYLLVGHGDRFQVGSLEFEVCHTPGHTPEHLVFLVTDRGGGADTPLGVATGDFLFVGDVGRPDLLESAAGEAGMMRPSAEQLQASLRQVQEWPEYLQIWPGHGAGSACGKSLGAIPMSTVGYERRFNRVLSLAEGPATVFVDAILDGQPEPPPYFARMKQVNRDGPPLLPAPTPLAELTVEEVVADPGYLVLDTRSDRRAFMAAHLPGSLHAPAGRNFVAAAGAYVSPADRLVLLAEAADLDTLQRQLTRVGLDGLVGWVPSHRLAEYLAAGGVAASIPALRFQEAVESGEDKLWIDVRGAAEHVADHLPGSLQIAQSRLAVELGRIPQGRPLTVHCATGGRAAMASAYLQRLGFEVRYVDDDFARWRGQTGVAHTLAR